MRLSCITSKVVSEALVTSKYLSGIGNDSLLGVWKFHSWFNVTAEYEVSRNWPEIISCFTGIRKWVLKMWWKWRPFCFSMEIRVIFSSNGVIPYEGGCSQYLVSSKKVLLFHLRLGTLNFHHFEAFITSFALSLLARIPDASISSSSSRSKTSMSPFQILPAYNT